VHDFGKAPLQKHKRCLPFNSTKIQQQKMDTSFSADKPISKSVDDKFQRYDFSIRIAKTILERESDDCIVIGIYGAWGEGKTSVINFIETELTAKSNVITIKFNPWRYSDENALLIHFFNKLSSSLKANLKTQTEKIGELLHKYGKLIKVDIPFVGNLGENLEAAGELMAEVDIEILKERIGTILSENKSKVVIFIDDIDRLDKTEIHSVFRLVKLTADFTNTTYLLSFDEQMVSAAIGDRFGEGNQKAGQNFLEKIIQVPLRIPKAQPDALKNFCFALVDKALNNNQIQLNEDEAQRFVREFVGHVLIKLDTPRLAVRYGNTLSFSLPLLYGEVNTVDLMLIEATKIFYPTYYEFIKNNPEYFIGAYRNSYSNNCDNDKTESIKKYFEELGINLTKRQKESAENLLIELFPRLKEVFQNYAFHSGTENEWFKLKRIASTKYFNRYFSYAVIDGELSDIAFETFLSTITHQKENETVETIKTLVSQSSPDNFLHKLRSVEEEITWDVSVKLVKAISKTSNIFPKNERGLFMFSFESSNSQAAIFIYQLIKKHSNKEEQFSLAKELMMEADPFEFAYEINNWLRSGDTPDQKIFTNEQYQALGKITLERALNEAQDMPIYLKFPDNVVYLFGSWAERDKLGLSIYIKEILDNHPKSCLDLFRSFTPTMHSTAYPKPYKVDFSEEQFNYFSNIFDIDYIDKTISKIYTDEELNSEEVKWTGRTENFQNDINTIRQFRHWKGNKSVVQS
jgi:predicted KAP-like P-loop ATPase